MNSGDLETINPHSSIFSNLPCREDLKRKKEEASFKTGFQFLKEDLITIQSQAFYFFPSPQSQFVHFYDSVLKSGTQGKKENKNKSEKY